jgi:hypothetical protein
MKPMTKTIVALACLVAVNTLAVAEEKNAPLPKPPGDMSNMMGMGGMGGLNEEQLDTHLKQVQEYLLNNYEFMHRIRETKDVKEQDKLKDEWLKSMKNHLKLNQIPKQLMMHGVPEHNVPEK